MAWLGYEGFSKTREIHLDKYCRENNWSVRVQNPPPQKLMENQHARGILKVQETKSRVTVMIGQAYSRPLRICILLLLRCQ